MLPPPPPSDFILVVHVDSMAAALAKLNIKVPVEDLVKAIREEDEAKGIKLFTGVALSECKSALIPSSLSDSKPVQCSQPLSSQPNLSPTQTLPNQIRC